MGMLLHGARTVRARSVHGARTVQCFWNVHPSFYPVEQPPQNHTQGPNFCTLRLLLAYQKFLNFLF